ncbi:MAG: hypothetical protein Q9162_004542 [Coniocarpon cinnabarinum]
MQYVRSMSGAVSKTWNSINPATLSGAIDVIVVEHPDGTLACSPFHVRFGKFSLLRPYEKKVEFRVNNVKQDYAMKLGEGGEAFFVFETFAHVPEQLQTSPLVSPAASPPARPSSSSSTADLEPLDLNSSVPAPLSTHGKRTSGGGPVPLLERRAQSEIGSVPQLSQSLPDETRASPLARAASESISQAESEDSQIQLHKSHGRSSTLGGPPRHERSQSPPALPRNEAVSRAKTLSEKLRNSNIGSTVSDEGNLMLDITGYKSSEEESLRAEVIARQILSEELEGHYDIGSLIGADEKGNLWIYNSEEAKDAASKKALFSGMTPVGTTPIDAISDPGYHSSDDTASQKSHHAVPSTSDRLRRESDSALGLSSAPNSPASSINAPLSAEPSKSYAKTLRLTSDQLKALDLKPGANPISFSVNRAVCSANMFLWRHDAPIVISDVDGTITKSDALGHVLNMIGRDWTHIGVAKLYTDIVANGYVVLYLTSRSVGQADSTRTYLNGITQDGGYRLPKGPVILSPDRTIAALRREIYLRQPEVFKMACLRDIMSLFPQRKSPFYAGFGNRLTDALSYRSVNIPSTRIFTINSNAEVSLHLETLNMYKTGYTTMRETVDHFFPPTSMLVQEGGEDYTEFNYWRDRPRDSDEFSMTSSEGSDDGHLGPFARRHSTLSNDEEDEEEIMSGDEENMHDSYISRDSIDGGSSIFNSPNAPLSPAVTRRSMDSLAAAGVRPSLESAVAGRPSIEEALALAEEQEDADELELVTEAAGRTPTR